MFREDTIYAILSTGHSNCVGFTYQPPPTGYINEAADNKVVRGNPSNTALMVDDAYTPCLTGDSRNTRIANFMSENPAGNFWQRDYGGPIDYTILIARWLKKIIKKEQGKNIQFITINYAHNGSQLDNIEVQGSNPYIGKGGFSHQKMIEAVQTAKNYADSVGKKIEIPFIYLVNGAVDLHIHKTCTSKEEYKRLLNNFRYNVFVDTKNIINQNYIPKLFRFQEHLQAETELNNIIGKMISYDAADEQTPLITPSYQLSTLSGSHHFDTVNAFKLSIGIARAAYNHFYNLNSALQIIAVNKKSSRIVELLTNTNEKLKIVTKNTATNGHGFRHYDGVNFYDIKFVRISGKKIFIELNEDVIDGVSQIAYKSVVPVDDNRFGSFVCTEYKASFFGITDEQYLLSFMKDIKV